MTGLLTLLGLLAIAWVVALVWAAAWTRAYRAPDGEPYPIATEDGWTVWVHRYRPVGPPKGGPPVVLGHGFTMNRWCWSLSERGSLPILLAEQGYDVFVAEYRGSGRSRTPDDATLYAKRPGGFDGWGFDDHVTLDLPAIIDGVRLITGQSHVHWVGHSMGGMLGYSYALASKGAGLASLCTLGSPTRFEHIVHLFGPTGPLAWRGLHKLPKLHLRPLVRFGLPLALFMPRVTLRTSGSVEFLNVQERLTLMSEAFEDTSPALAGFFMDHWLHDRRLIPGDDAVSFGDLPVRTLVVAGVKDVLAPPQAARRAYDEFDPARAAAPISVSYRCFGDRSLRPHEVGPALGHADLISGEESMKHIVPLLDAWLSGGDLTVQPGVMTKQAADPLSARAF